MTDNVRLFVGVRLTMQTVRALEAVLPGLKQRAEAEAVPVRWVAPENFHITLKFLGWARSDAMYALRDALTGVAQNASPFAFATSGVGAFPDERKARVVWAGISTGGEPLRTLAEQVDRACAALGFAAESRPFHPHITLGRIREPASVGPLLEPLRQHRFEHGEVEELVLYESVSHGGSVVYEERGVLPLGRG